MKLCGKLAAPGAPGNAEMSFQTGTRTAEGLQLPKTWVTWTLGPLKKGKEEGKGAGGEEDRGERRAVTRGWEWGRREAGPAEPWRSSSLGEESETSSYHTPLLDFGGQGWCPALNLRVWSVVYQPKSRLKWKPLWPSSLRSPYGKRLL